LGFHLFQKASPFIAIARGLHYAGKGSHLQHLYRHVQVFLFF